MKKYRYLRGKLMQLGMQHGYIAKKLGLAESSFSARMRGNTPFKSDEMWAIMKIIDAPAEELHRYFPANGEEALANG